MLLNNLPRTRNFLRQFHVCQQLASRTGTVPTKAEAIKGWITSIRSLKNKTFMTIGNNGNFTQVLCEKQMEKDLGVGDAVEVAGHFQVHVPILTTNDCEGAGQLFEVFEWEKGAGNGQDDSEKRRSFFRQRAFLSVSGQLHLEAMCAAFEKVYSFGPAFRAEHSHTRQHLAEFYMVELEMAFIDSLDVLLELNRQLIVHVWQELNKSTVFAHFLRFGRTGASLADFSTSDPWPRISYDEAAAVLQAHGSKLSKPFRPGGDFAKEHEQFLVEHCAKGHPVFVVDFPADIKPFYMKLSKKDPSRVNSFDLLVPGVGELSGGSLREEDHERMVAAIGRQRATMGNLDWYVGLRQSGASVPHGGFGIGFDRLLVYLLGVENIRQVVPFPRYYNNCLF